MQEIASAFTIVRVHVAQGDYGANTDKPTWLWSAHEEICDIHRYAKKQCKKKKRPSLVRTWDGPAGQTKYEGNRELKASENYTKQFGEALHNCWKKTSNPSRSSSPRSLLRLRKRAREHMTAGKMHSDLSAKP